MTLAINIQVCVPGGDHGYVCHTYFLADGTYHEIYTERQGEGGRYLGLFSEEDLIPPPVSHSLEETNTMAGTELRTRIRPNDRVQYTGTASERIDTGKIGTAVSQTTSGMWRCNFPARWGRGVEWATFAERNLQVVETDPEWTNEDWAPTVGQRVRITGDPSDVFLDSDYLGKEGVIDLIENLYGEERIYVVMDTPSNPETDDERLFFYKKMLTPVVLLEASVEVTKKEIPDHLIEKSRVYEVAMQAAEKHDLCDVVEKTLAKMGIHPPEEKVTVTFDVNLPGGRYKDIYPGTVARVVRRMLTNVEVSGQKLSVENVKAE